MNFKPVAWRWRYYTDYGLEDRWFYSEDPEWEQDHPELIGVIDIQRLYIDDVDQVKNKTDTELNILQEIANARQAWGG